MAANTPGNLVSLSCDRHTNSSFLGAETIYKLLYADTDPVSPVFEAIGSHLVLIQIGSLWKCVNPEGLSKVVATIWIRAHAEGSQKRFL
jgi:hypothetical protein